MICVNLYGGPGIGKSTLAAKVFAKLKDHDIKTELVGEFAKELLYDRAYNVMSDQHYLFAQQAHRLWRLDKYGVEVAVCDSPLLLNLAYDCDPNNGYFISYVIDTYKRYQNLDYVLKRDESFWTADKRSGKIQDAVQMDHKIDAILYDVWHDSPAKIAPDALDIVEYICCQVEDLVQENKIYGAASVKLPPYKDEPWKVA